MYVCKCVREKVFQKIITHFLCSVALRASLVRRFIASSRDGSATPSNLSFPLSAPSPLSIARSAFEAAGAAATLCPVLSMKGLVGCKLPGGVFLDPTKNEKQKTPGEERKSPWLRPNR